MGVALNCCNRSDTGGDIPKPKEDEAQKLGGYNTQQKITELKAYRFFINHLLNLMLINNGIEYQDFFFIRKSWIKSWAKYTCYHQIRPLLIKNEINNELDFHKTIIDHKKELNFEGFVEKEKPGPLRFFEINKLNTNIKENFYIFDSKILKQFIEIYEYEDNNNEGKQAFCLKGEIGKGRIIFDVKEYTLIMFLNKNWEIKQIMVIFGTEAEHKHFVKSVSGRALTFICKELKKITQKKQMVTYKKDEIFVYDNRDFIKYEFVNNNDRFKKTGIKNKENKENEQEENLNKNKSLKNFAFDKHTDLYESVAKEKDNDQGFENFKFLSVTKDNKSNQIKENIQFKDIDDVNDNKVNKENKENDNIAKE